MRPILQMERSYKPSESKMSRGGTATLRELDRSFTVRGRRLRRPATSSSSPSYRFWPSYHRRLWRRRCGCGEDPSRGAFVRNLHGSRHRFPGPSHDHMTGGSGHSCPGCAYPPHRWRFRLSSHVPSGPVRHLTLVGAVPRTMLTRERTRRFGRHWRSVPGLLRDEAGYGDARLAEAGLVPADSVRGVSLVPSVTRTPASCFGASRPARVASNCACLRWGSTQGGHASQSSGQRHGAACRPGPTHRAGARVMASLKNSPAPVNSYVSHDFSSGGPHSGSYTHASQLIPWRSRYLVIRLP